MPQTPDDDPSLPEHIEDSVHALAELHADHHRQAPPLQRSVDRAVSLVGRPGFIAVITLFVAGWIGINLALSRIGAAFDEPPYPVLDGVATIAALYIAVLILITQRHEAELTDHRAQLTLELAVLGDQKNAKIVDLLEEMRRDNPMMKDRADPHADALSVPANPQQVLEAIKAKHGEMLATVDAELAGRTKPAADAE